MENTDFFSPLGLEQRPLVPANILAADALVAEAGWNQTRSDWSYLITHGLCRGVFDRTGRLVATAAILPHGQRIAWICMVLVNGAWRNKGIATELLRQAITEAESFRMVPGLDATEAGRPVYLPLGFRDVYALSRMEAAQPLAIDTGGCPAARPMTHEDLPGISRLDASILGVPRDSLLSHLLERAPHFAWVVEDHRGVSGFCLGRDGRDADQIGPIVCRDDGQARALLAAALAARTAAHRRVYLDVADRQMSFRRVLDHAGFTRQRGFTRMVKGLAFSLGNPATLYAIAGPELA